MSTHNICFHGEIRKIITGYPLLSRPMIKVSERRGVAVAQVTPPTPHPPPLRQGTPLLFILILLIVVAYILIKYLRSLIF